MLQFSQPEMQSMASSLFSAYASFAAMMMMIRSMTNDVVPESIRSRIMSFISYFLTPVPSSMTIVIDEQSGMSRNEVYDAAEVYLSTKISPATERLKVNKTVKQKELQVSIEKNEQITDVFRGFQLRWRFISVEPSKHSNEKRYFELTFNKMDRERVVDEYLPYVLAKSKEIKDEDKVVKLYTTDRPSYDDDGGDGVWGSIQLDHPATFEKLAMDPEMKKAVIDDLERFVRRKDYYKKVGKAWKRGYLLYGPPGTGKSSLIAAMANYLKFDVYDLELANLYSNADLRRILVSTTNKSIIVIEDIDCSLQMQDREQSFNQGYGYNQGSSHTKLTLSGLLNFIDGLWSSCGDERIIIFTTNHKDKLDPALLRPGRMDMHIHMSYCTFAGFKLLASNYLSVSDHELYEEIESLLANVQVTPAEVAEELMKSEDGDIALLGLVEFMKRKKLEPDETKEKTTNNVVEEEQNLDCKVNENGIEENETTTHELHTLKTAFKILSQNNGNGHFRFQNIRRRGGGSRRLFSRPVRGYSLPYIRGRKT